MKLQDAEALLDGGTTCLTVIDGLETIHITLDYSLPWDGRKRYVYKGITQFSTETQLKIGSAEERKIIKWLEEELNEKFGATQVQSFLDGKIDNFGTGKWMFALRFLQIMSQERDYI